MSVARRFIVKGRVQGVFFRDSTRRVAESLGLTGHALNLPEGDVEVLACGDAKAVAKLETWLHEGPPLSRVTSVDSSDVETPELRGFRTG
ncbi:MAG: acylphosphatase [Woeseiaceae bacterium]|nr:acylphosphatase [Woeseiaceae bacterium]